MRFRKSIRSTAKHTPCSEGNTFRFMMFIGCIALTFNGAASGVDLQSDPSELKSDARSAPVEKSPESKLVKSGNYDSPDAEPNAATEAGPRVERGVGGLGAYLGSITPAVTGLPVSLGVNLFGGLIVFTDAPDEIHLIDPGTGASGFSVDISATTTLWNLGAAFDTSDISAGAGIPILMTNDSTVPEVDTYDNFAGYVATHNPANLDFGEGVAWDPDSGNFFVLDSRFPNDVVIEITPAGTQINEYTLTSTTADAIGFDPVRSLFWIYNRGTDSVSSFDRSFNPQETFVADIFTLSGAAGTGEGLTVFGNTLYIVEPFSGDIYMFDISAALPGMSSSSNFSILLLIVALTGVVSIALVSRRYFIK